MVGGPGGWARHRRLPRLARNPSGNRALIGAAWLEAGPDGPEILVIGAISSAGMARHAVGPRRAGSHPSYLRATGILAGLSLLLLSGAMAWDLVNDRFWGRHALFASLVAGLIVVAVTAAVLMSCSSAANVTLAVLAQYALFDLFRTARLVWVSLLELARLVPDGEIEGGALDAGSEVVHDTPRLAQAIDEMMASDDSREQLHRLITETTQVTAGKGRARAMGEYSVVNSGTYAEVVDRHVKLLLSRLY